MNAMPMNVAQQLVADRRASYEGFASRRRLRMLSRRAVYEAANEAPVARPLATTAGDSRVGSTPGAAALTVA
ncbi:MAG: hypothetical protein JWM72_1359 [Actinomycetia bacterium]|nr:hypothetical protein [Actinomycetes bacterium]MDQ1458561.1 hypothetical protein [Actinomycetota bacterium]